MRHGLHVPAVHVQAIAGVVVPDNFRARFGNREGKGAVREVGDTIATVNQLGLTGSRLDLVIDRLRVTNSTLGLVDRHLEGLGIALEHGNLARGQVVLVLLVVLRGDDEFRLLASKGVFVEVVTQSLTSVGRQAAGPFRDSTGGVTRLLGTNRRQGSTQLINLSLGQGLRHNGGCHQAQSHQRSWCSSGWRCTCWRSPRSHPH